VEQKFILLNIQLCHIIYKSTLWQIIEIQGEVVEIELQRSDKVEILANFRDDLIVLVLEDQNDIRDHSLMHRHNGKLKALRVYLLRKAYCNAHFFVLGVYHVQHSLENENVLFLHLFDLQFKFGC
jgi:hypothetical protein